MKRKLLLTLFLGYLATTSLIAQRANLDKEYFKVSYVRLPSNPILDNAKRTYSSNERGINLSGFSRLNSNATLDFRFDFHGTKIREVDIRKRKREEKDKDGNVIKTYFLYSAVVDYKSTATLTTTNTETGDTFSSNFSTSSKYHSKDFNSSYAASKYYNNNRHNIRDNYRVDHRNYFINSANNGVNRMYGYVPRTTERSEKFWIIATQKHPEFSKHQEASSALKTIFNKMQYDLPLDEIAQEVQPWIEYFDNVAARYTKEDKKHRKVRYASYYNNAQIYYHLEQFDKSKAYAEKLIANGYDTKDGKRFISEINQLKERLKINELKTRHFEVITEDLSAEPEVQIQQVIMAGTPKEESEKLIAFLINASNDTLQTAINADRLKNMSANAMIDDTAGNLSEILAKDHKKMVLTTGDTYDVITFVSIIANTKDASPKFAKSVYDGKNVSLYEHMGKEYVIFLKSETEGISTMNKEFVFGFNKKLASFCVNCDSLKAKVEAGEYKNTKESLSAFCKALDECIMAK